MLVSIRERCDAIESCYEFMLAYAGQGVSGEPGSSNADQARTMLQASAQALDGLADAFRQAVAELGVDCAGQYHAFIDVLDRDAQAGLAAVRLVLTQPAISSLLVDNLNASIHVRAVLTDLFLLDEMLAPRAQRSSR